MAGERYFCFFKRSPRLAKGWKVVRGGSRDTNRETSRETHADVFTAAYEGDLASVKSFVAASADVNSRDKKGQPLLLAARGPHGNQSVIETLLEQGANPNPKGIIVKRIGIIVKRIEGMGADPLR